MLSLAISQGLCESIYGDSLHFQTGFSILHQVPEERIRVHCPRSAGRFLIKSPEGRDYSSRLDITPRDATVNMTSAEPRAVSKLLPNQHSVHCIRTPGRETEELCRHTLVGGQFRKTCSCFSMPLLPIKEHFTWSTAQIYVDPKG